MIGSGKNDFHHFFEPIIKVSTFPTMTTDVFSYKFVWENWTAISEHFEFGSDWVLSTRGNWFSPTAILRRIHPIPSELGSQAAKGPVSTGVGDRPGSP
jgi:hypothetical protein